MTVLAGHRVHPAALMSVIAMSAVLGSGITVEVRAQRATELVTWSGRLVAGETAGEAHILHLRAEIADAWKMYALDSPRPSRGVEIMIQKLPESLTLAGEPRQSTPRDAFDPNFRTDVRFFEGDAAFEMDLHGDATPGHEVSGTVTFQICNDHLGICLPPTEVPFSIPTDGREVAFGASCDAVGNESSQAPTGDCVLPESDVTASLQVERGSGDEAVGLPGGSRPGFGREPADYGPGRGFLPFLLLAAGAGLAALLTPCVFPMIPLTVSYFAKRSVSRRQAATLAVVYGVAIITTFTGLGIVMALVVGAAGAQTIAANPWVNLFIATVLIVFALSLLGMFELRLPASAVNYFYRKGEAAGYIGVLFMGFAVTLVSFSCTAPFVGGLLAATAGGEWFYPVLGMIVFSGAFSLPFVLLSLFPAALESLPRSGSWMNAFKVTLGFIELAAAIKFLSNADLIWRWNIVSRPLAIAVTTVIFALAGLYLIGKVQLAGEELPERVGVGRLVSGIAFFGFALYMLPGLFGAPLNRIDAYLPPRQATDIRLLAGGIDSADAMRTADGGVGWIEDDIDLAMSEAVRLERPVFIDFTGYTCTNCREMESNVFVRPQVSERFERNYVRLRLFTDTIEKGQEYQRYQLRMTGTVALPTYAVVDGSSGTLIRKESGVMSLDDFVEFLDAGSAGYLQGTLASRQALAPL